MARTIRNLAGSRDPGASGRRRAAGSANAAVLVLCALTLGATAYVAVNLPTGPGGDGALDTRLAAIEKQTAAVQATQVDLRDAVARMERRLAAAPARAAAPPAEQPGAAGTAGAGTSGSHAAGGTAGGGTASTGDAAHANAATIDAVSEAVAARLEKRIDAIAARDHARGNDGKWKAPIDELAKELDIDAAKKAEVAQVLDDGRDKVCALLLTKRVDGTTMLDDLATTIRDGNDPGAAFQTFIKRIMVERVPDSDQTYFAEVVKITEGVEASLATKLDPARMDKFRALHVDILDVKTGHDPVGEALQARIHQ